MTSESVSKGAFLYKGKRSQMRLDNYIDDEDHCDGHTVHLGLDLLDTVSDTVQILQSDFNCQIFDDLIKYIKKAQSGFNPSASSNRLNIRREIPTAALITGVNSPDHAAMFSTLSAQLMDEVTSHIAVLQARDCSTLKTLIAKLLTQLIQNASMDTDDDDEGDCDININRVSCTINVLESWYADTCTILNALELAYLVKSYRALNTYHIIKKHQSGRKRRSTGEVIEAAYPPIVIIVEDLEGFTPQVLQDFVTICSNHLSTLPLVLVFGIATAMTAVHRLMPHSVSSLLCMEKFQVAPATVYFTEVIEKILLNIDIPLKLSSRVFSFLLDVFLYHDFSVLNFINSYKFCLLEHFYCNPHSRFCQPLTEALKDLKKCEPHQLDYLRTLRSFRRFVERQDPQEQIDLLENSNRTKFVMSTMLQHIFHHQQHFYPVIYCLHSLVGQLPKYPLGKQVRELYANCLSSHVCELPEYESAFLLLHTLSRDELVNYLLRCSTILSESALEELQQEADKLSELVEKILDIEDLTSTLESVDKDENDNESKTVLPKKLDMYTLRQKLQAMEKKKKPPTIYETLRADSLKCLDRIFRQYLLCPRSLPLHEVYYYDNIHEVRSRINGTPRSIIQNALAQPQHYIEHPGCECSLTGIPASLPDLSLVYKLHCECGRLINLYDWLQAFTSVVQSGEGNKKRKTSNKVDEVLQARFIAAVSELQFLGFIKSTKRKTDHVARLTW